MKFKIRNSQFKKNSKRARAPFRSGEGQVKTKIKQSLSDAFYRAVCVMALFLMGLFLISAGKPSSVSLAMTEQDYNQQINQLNTQKDAANKSLGVKKIEDQTLSGEVAKFNAQIGSLQAQINNTQAQMDAINAQITDTNNKIAAAETDIKTKKESLDEYLRVLYEESNTSTIELIASSDSFSDFIDKTEYNLTMQEKIKDTVSAIKDLKKELENKKGQLVEQNKQIESLKDQQVAQRQGLDGQRAAKNNLLASTRGQEAN